MKILFTISTEHGGMYFAIFYTIAFLLGILIFIYEGFRKKYPKLPWLLIALSGVVFFILGSKLFSCPPEEWKQIFTELRFPSTSGKTILGGIIGLIVGVFLASRFLKFRRPVFDNLAIALPIGMAIQRVGCLLTGCCFGKPTQLPWAVKYGSNALPFHTHCDNGLIHLHDSASMPIHPTQLYQIIGCLIIAVIIWRTRKYWKASGSLFLFSVMLYGCLRFFTEFFRDPVANHYFMGEIFWGLKYLQWCIAGSLLIIGSFLIFRERKYKEFIINNSNIRDQLVRPVLLIVFIFILYGITKNWFDIMEKLSIHLIMIPVIIMLCWKVFQKFTLPRYRWITAMVCFFSIALMSQTYIPKNPEDKITYTEVGIGGMISKYYESVRQYEGEIMGCLGPYAKFSKPEMHEFSSISYGFHVTHYEVKSLYKRFKFRFAAFAGKYHASNVDSKDVRNEVTIGFNPYLQWDWRNVGFGTGIHVGSFNYAQIHKSTKRMAVGEWENSHNEFWFFPQVHLRLGPYDIAYIEGNLANHFPTSSPMPLYMAGLGTGLGRVDGTKIGTGISDAGYYLQAIYPIKKKFVLEAFYADNLKSGYNLRRMFSFGFSYRFNYKTVKRNKYKLKSPEKI